MLTDALTVLLVMVLPTPVSLQRQLQLLAVHPRPAVVRPHTKLLILAPLLVV